jgi:hypothetical protein
MKKIILIKTQRFRILREKLYLIKLMINKFHYKTSLIKTSNYIFHKNFDKLNIKLF